MPNNADAPSVPNNVSTIAIHQSPLPHSPQHFEVFTSLLTKKYKTNLCKQQSWYLSQIGHHSLASKKSDIESQGFPVIGSDSLYAHRSHVKSFQK